MYRQRFTKAREKTPPRSPDRGGGLTIRHVTIMQAMILAAGFGTRLRPYTLVRPKPLFPVLNRPLLHILLEDLQRAGCRKILVNAHHLADQIRLCLDGCPGVILLEEEEILGTGGALRRAAPHLDDEPLVVINGDILHTIDVGWLHDQHLRGGCSVTLALHDCARFNTVRVLGDRVLGFGGPSTDQVLAFTGIHVLEREVIDLIPATGFFHIIDLYEQLAQSGRIGLVRVDDCFWRDIGTPQDYLDLHRELLLDHTPIRPRGRMRKQWLLGDGVEIHPTARLRGWGCLGPGVVIGPGAVLERSVVWKKARIEAGLHLSDSIVTG